MTDFADLVVYTTQTGDKWLAATNSSPYFCFEAESEKAALAKAARALHFAQTVNSKLERGREGPVHNWHKTPARELAAA